MRRDLHLWCVKNAANLVVGAMLLGAALSIISLVI